MRAAWQLASNDRRPAFVRQILRLARTPEEALDAVPRSDAELDIFDARSLSMASKIARALGKNDWSKTFLASASTENAEAGVLKVLAREAIAAQAPDIAEQAALRLRELSPNEALPALLLAELYLVRGAIEDAKKEAQFAVSIGGEEAIPALHLLIDVALEAKDDDAARKTFARLTEVTAPTRRGQVELAKYEAMIESNAGNPSSALKALSRALELAPENVQLHLQKARVLMETGHLKPAADELAYVLALRPQHKGAQRLLAKIEAMQRRTQMPENEAKSDDSGLDSMD
jgi:predicted Zn-dependent protease